MILVVLLEFMQCCQYFSKSIFKDFLHYSLYYHITMLVWWHCKGTYKPGECTACAPLVRCTRTVKCACIMTNHARLAKHLVQFAPFNAQNRASLAQMQLQR